MKTTAERVIKEISEQLGAEESAVSNAADLRTAFGMDSLDEIELIMMLEDEFNLVIDGREPAKWKTADDVIAYIEEQLTPKGMR